MKLSAALALVLLCGSASAQVVVNEVYANPPGSGSIDDRWEYVEIYGPPGMSLTGYLVASVYGGADQNANNIPGPLPAGWDVGDDLAEIDEAWSLDGQTIGSNGLFVLYNNARAGSGQPSLARPMFDPATTFATFQSAHCPSTDTAGRIKNDGSATFVLIRERPFHAVDASGISVYDGVPGNTIVSGPGTYPAMVRYAWRKDVNPDADFNGKIDFNGLGTLVMGGGPNPPETPVNSENAATPPVQPPHSLEPYQMVDDVAWSNGGGKEYTRDQEQEISDTPGYNPDAISRVAYFGANPQRGHVFVNGTMSDSRMADEEFIYGDIADTGPQGLPLVQYDAAARGGPTDPDGPRYNAQAQLDPAGAYLLDDINLTGYRLTPGNFNDVDSSGGGGINIVQSRLVRGDFNFDGIVDCSDQEMIQAGVGAGLDDAEAHTSGNNTPDDPGDDFTYTRWKYQGRAFNSLLAMVRMSLADGTTGEWNSGVTVTQADLDAFNALFGGVCCPADFNRSGGVPDDADVAAFFSAWSAGDDSADINRSGGTPDDADVSFFFMHWSEGC